MTSCNDQSRSDSLQPQLVPGFLLAPFGWAADQIAAVAASEPALCACLFEMGRVRMHGIALALAHIKNEMPLDLGSFLVRASVPDILDRFLGRRPIGIKRAFAHLPETVLARENYRRLIDLLEHRDSAKLLHHVDDIDDGTISALHSAPAALRKIAMTTAKGCCHRVEGLGDGLQFLVSRGVAASFDGLVADLTNMTQPPQLIARIKALIARLPMPEQLPPRQIGKARRLDQPTEIRRLAKTWNNCLATYARRIDDGGCAIYLWEDPISPAACLLDRCGRFGWFIEDVKGPQNVELEAQALAPIYRAFADAGIEKTSLITALQAITEAEGFFRNHVRRRAHDPLNDDDG